MGPKRLDRARTVESIAAVPAPGRSPWAGAVLVRYPPRAVGLTAGAAVGLPGAAAVGHGELLFLAVDSGGRSAGPGRRNRPRVAGIVIVPAQGRPAWTGIQRRLPYAGRLQLVERDADPAVGKQPCHGSRHRGRNPGLAASGDAAEPPRRPSASHHDRRTCRQPETRRDYRDRRPDRRRLRMGHSRPPGGAVKAVLSPSSPPPERPQPHSLRGAPGSRGGAWSVISACGPLLGSTPGSAEAQVLTFGMSSQRVV